MARFWRTAPAGGGLISSSPSGVGGSYFYHSDHLGSSSLITDQFGEIVQHLEYVPFGETFIDERKSQSSWTTPYLFSGKERDEETGLLYFGARYQDSKYGIWYSVDPLAEKYPGVSPYVYCLDNPVKYVDPDGKDVFIWFKDKKGNDQLYRFNGRNKMAPNNQYVLDFIDAYNYDVKNGGGQNVKEAVTNPNMILYVADPENGVDQYVSDASQPTVFWNSRQGYVTTEGGHQSAATAIEHEMDHAVDDARNSKLHHERKGQGGGKFENKEEQRVSTGSEAKTAKANKESISKDSNGKPYKTISPTSTKQFKQKNTK